MRMTNTMFFPQVKSALAEDYGFPSVNLIVGIDFTKSNQRTGSGSVNGWSLHDIGDAQNPYEQVISLIGRTLCGAEFPERSLIPCFGFGDASTEDRDIFSFYPDKRPCRGYMEALKRYREIVPHVQLAGWPRSFAPIIEMAMNIVKESSEYHVLLIIAEGQVTRSTYGQLSPQEKATVNAIGKACKYKLSIVVVGVGNGPWDRMMYFIDNMDCNISCGFPNSTFVNFTQIMSQDMPVSKKEAEFSLEAVGGIPMDYTRTTGNQEWLSYSGTAREMIPPRIPRPPPPLHIQPSAPPVMDPGQICPICMANFKDMAFGCGHQTVFHSKEMLSPVLTVDWARVGLVTG
ncbi:Copine [Macleaya cordata]|uniref:Copine n=1 Tax=Macleaya cordata TaxID=56857 RepID=A0A200R0X5_MACCD|nr:Copine [Macleaya cordata]